jgi:hypothetical protein
MRTWRQSSIASPESMASILAGIVAVVLISTQVIASPAGSPSGSASPGPMSSAAPTATFPPLIRSSLAAILIVNDRLATRADELSQAIAVADPVAEDIAAILRGINTEMAVGNEAANRLLALRETAELGDALLAFYASVAAANAVTLGTSIRNLGAYVDGARRVIEILEGVGALNVRVQAVLDQAVSSPQPSPSPVRPTPSPTPTPTPPPPPPPTPPPTAPPTAPPTVPPPATPPAGSPAPSDGGLIRNGNFEDELTSWRLLVTAPASASATLEPNGGIGGTAAARIDIAAGSEARTGISFVNGGIAVRQGASYTVSAAVRAAETREIRIRVIGAGDLTYAARIFTVTQNWTVVTFNLSQLSTDPAAELTLDLGRSGATVWFDDVTMRESPG